MLNIMIATQEASVDYLTSAEKQVVNVGVVTEVTLGSGGNFYEGLPRQGWIPR